MGSDALTVTLHAFAYGGTAFSMIKNYVEFAQTIEKAKNDPDKLWMMRMKQLKFILATFAAGFGLSTLFFKATSSRSYGPFLPEEQLPSPP